MFDDETVWHAFLLGFSFVQLFNLSYLVGQVIPWCGRNGAYPFEKHHALRVANFPSYFLRALYWPSQILPFVNDTILVGIPVIGAVAMAVFGLTLHPWALAVGHACWIFCLEPNLLGWPWHCVVTEISWVLVFHSFSGLPATPAPITTFALRCLLFRLMFGFGKMKFKDSKRSDWLYVRPFMIGIPLPTPFGLFLYRHAPLWFFYLGYFLFFLSEIIAPFAFFGPYYMRVGAALFCVQLMVGIQLTGSFGSFNILTAVLTIPLLLPAGLPTVTVAGALITCQILLGIVMVPFNSWVAQSWHQWSSIYRSSPKFMELIAIISMWRIAHPYGVFPPNIMPPQRQPSVYQVSRDGGKTWVSLRYRYQPTLATDPTSFYPMIHPILDWVSFYKITGFANSMVDCRSPFSNHLVLSPEVIAMNLLETNGRVVDLFADGSREIVKGATMVRIIQRTLIPVMRVVDGVYWQVIDGATEVVASTHADFTSLEVSPFHASLEDSDFELTLWRRRSAPWMRRVRPFVSAATPKELWLAMTLSPEATRWISVAVGCKSHAEAATAGETCPLSDVHSIRYHALAVLHSLEDRFYLGDSHVAATLFDLYHVGLWLLCDPKARLASASWASLRDIISNRKTTKHPQSESLFCFLFARSLRASCSIHRRLVDTPVIVTPRDKSADAVVPGFFPYIVDVLYPLVPLAEGHPKETTPMWKFNAATGEFDFWKLS